MMEDELVKIWQSSPNQERVKFEKSRLMIDVQSGIDRVERMIRIRDSMETFGVITVVPAFTYIAYDVPFITSKIASVCVVIWAIYVFFKIKAAKKHKAQPFSEAYLPYLYKTREHLRAQKHLIDTILWWYILPGYLMINLFIAGFIHIPERRDWLIKMEIGATALGVCMYVVNKWSAKKTLVPRLKKIDDLIDVLEKS